ncbi:hypothetical protein U3516DRAFT_765204 [Neocallimastix sp. 'constans']
MFKCKQLNNSYIHLRIDYILFNQELNKLFDNNKLLTEKKEIKQKIENIIIYNMINNNSYKGPLVIVIPNSFITSSESNSKDIKLKIETIFREFLTRVLINEFNECPINECKLILNSIDYQFKKILKKQIYHGQKIGFNVDSNKGNTGKNSQFDETLRTGNFAVIKRGKNRYNGENIVIKILEKERLMLKTSQKMENIIQIYDMYEDNKLVYLVLELGSRSSKSNLKPENILLVNNTLEVSNIIKNKNGKCTIAVDM